MTKKASLSPEEAAGSLRFNNPPSDPSDSSTYALTCPQGQKIIERYLHCLTYYKLYHVCRLYHPCICARSLIEVQRAIVSSRDKGTEHLTTHWQHRRFCHADPRINALRAKIYCMEVKRVSLEYHDPSKCSIGNALLVELNNGMILDEVET